MNSYSNLDAIRALPKADKHLHLLLSAPIDTYRELSPRLIPNPPSPSFGSLQNFLAFLTEYYLPVLNSLENVAFVTRSAFQYLISDGVVLAEASVPLTAPARVGVDWKDYAAAIAGEIARVSDKLEVRVELGHAREIPIDWKPPMQSALATGLFSGIDLFGDESHGDVVEFAEFFSVARANGLYVKLHCGECTSADRMRHDVEFVKPDEIQHGIAAANDPELMALLRDTGTPLNVCPTSNVMTGSVKSYDAHPIANLLKHGVNVQLASDDYGIFGTSLSEEYLRLITTGRVTIEQLERIRFNGLLKARKVDPLSLS